MLYFQVILSLIKLLISQHFLYLSKTLLYKRRCRVVLPTKTRNQFVQTVHILILVHGVCTCVTVFFFFTNCTRHIIKTLADLHCSGHWKISNLGLVVLTSLYFAWSVQQDHGVTFIRTAGLAPSLSVTYYLINLLKN